MLDKLFCRQKPAASDGKIAMVQDAEVEETEDQDEVDVLRSE